MQYTEPYQNIRSPPIIDGEPKMAEAAKHCHSCHTTETPEWRKGPMGKNEKALVKSWLKLFRSFE